MEFGEEVDCEYERIRQGLEKGGKIRNIGNVIK
jgi:hypothetical protein